MIKKIDVFIIIINIIFFAYYAIQLLVFTDEFAINNLGFFNHAVAGLSEIIGIIFTTFIIALLIIVFRGLEKQLPLISIIILFQILAALNFWRYVFTDSPGETNLTIITINALFFSIMSCLNLILISKNINEM
ncbi:hypothetical protein OA255_00865 [Pelagibacteraceae bacterium]|nr:hypothetical protein [Pelagibacteraceae bacterium]